MLEGNKAVEKKNRFRQPRRLSAWQRSLESAGATYGLGEHGEASVVRTKDSKEALLGIPPEPSKSLCDALRP
jgi:hypothetical protein